MKVNHKKVFTRMFPDGDITGIIDELEYYYVPVNKLKDKYVKVNVEDLFYAVSKKFYPSLFIRIIIMLALGIANIVLSIILFNQDAGFSPMMIPLGIIICVSGVVILVITVRKKKAATMLLYEMDEKEIIDDKWREFVHLYRLKLIEEQANLDYYEKVSKEKIDTESYGDGYPDI